MKGLHWIAIPVAAIAVFFSWVAPPGQIAFVLFAFAFVICGVGLVEAVNRCANAIEKRG